MTGELSAALIAFGGILFLLAQHPFVTYPLSLRLLRRLCSVPLRSASEGPTPGGYTVCVCAYNEARIIEAKVRNLLEMRRSLGTLDILIYVDGATDGTAEILKRFEGEITIVNAPERAGKTVGMNTLVSLAKTPFVIFSDANVMVDPASIRNLDRYFRDPGVGCVCGHLTYVNASASATARVGSAYWTLEEYIKRLESETGSVMGADGSLFAIRRALFRPIPPDIIDDMFTSLSILCDGWRVVSAPDVRAFEEQAVRTNEEFRRKVRIACQAFNIHRLLWPRLRRLEWVSLYKYVSHKLLRWLVAYDLALAAVFILAGLLGSVGLANTVACLVGLTALIGVLWWVRPRLVRLGFEFLSAITATAAGVAKSFQGERFQTWTPPESARGRSS
jgi:cellulose synthase/poly-beta-1,6-N-acetylglucosamine synthase-like glycosyltransferase